MSVLTVLALCSFAVAAVHSTLTWMPDKPFESVILSERAQLGCCYTDTSGSTGSIQWFKNLKNITASTIQDATQNCSYLTIDSTKLNDSGFYQCLHDTSGHLWSHGTYLQIYEPLEKIINLREATKNQILTAEGFLLLLCVLLPSATLFCKSKKLAQLEKRKAAREEENIYQGLNLEECAATYDQIVRTQDQCLYEDIGFMKEDMEDEEIQLEKP